MFFSHFSSMRFFVYHFIVKLCSHLYLTKPCLNSKNRVSMIIIINVYKILLPDEPRKKTLESKGTETKKNE